MDTGACPKNRKTNIICITSFVHPLDDESAIYLNEINFFKRPDDFKGSRDNINDHTQH